MISCIIGGDIVPSFNNIEPFKQGNLQSIVDEECQEILSCADFRVFNLETPITDRVFPIDKEGANFAASIRVINGLTALKADVLNLANNHCKDQGADGLLSTIEILKSHNIRPIGYGTGFQDCESTVYLNRNGITLAIVTCAETEFTIWSNGSIGAVPYHDYYTNKFISEAKEKADAVVVLYHGGKEYFQYSAPYQRERCRLMVECGADLVLCQHSHCISCFEEYHGGTILYGQGNFIFHQRNGLPQTKEGLLVKFTVEKTSTKTEFLPIVLDENDRACIAKSERAEAIMDSFCERSRDCGEVLNAFRAFADEKAYLYYSRLQGSNYLISFIRRIFRKLNITTYSKNDKLALLNLLQNEAHRELFIQALKNDLKLG